MPEWQLSIPVPPTQRTPEPLPSGLPGLLIQHDVPEGAGPDKVRSRGRPLAIIVHGAMAHKNAIFYKPIAQGLSIDSFRCDFRGEGEAPGTWCMSDMVDWISDIHAVVEHLTTEFGYRVELFVGHSKGSFSMNGYLATHCVPGAPQYQPPPRLVVSIAGRYRMERIHDFDPLFNPEFEQRGYFEYVFRCLGETRHGKFTPEDRVEFESYPMRKHISMAPINTQYLIVHGMEDQVVPTSDLAFLSSALTAQRGRAPGSVQSVLIEHADHNFTQHRDELLDIVFAWINERLNPLRNVPATSRGALIVVEGLDRAGKSTQVARIVEHFDAQLIKFPDRTTAIGGQINDYLTKKAEMDDHAVHLLFSANRWEVLPQLLEALKSGRTVVCDRYAFSGIAYSAAKGLDLPWCISPDVGLPLPDVSIFLDVDDNVAAQRSDYGQERYENQAFQREVRSHFNLLETLVRSNGGEWVRIDAGDTIDNVWSKVQSAVADARRRADNGAPLGTLGAARDLGHSVVRHSL
ncbi:dTMP kinase [Malassezia cuniculi]|uniref:Thymidylate kinase n=1 Tax=Malassezia cuniculi TaxID=948313 RepID=A0AAF0EVU7_9BASI|nr:dTMP kinase [Malassezia cuniculi]